MPDPARARRLAKRIATIVASTIEHEIKDPRLSGVTITDAKVTADLHDATLYYTVMGRTLDDDPDYAGAAAALERARGVLRTKVGAGTGVRFTPTLTFTRDVVPDTAHRMDELLARARAADADLARVRSGAKPAGEVDPYRVAPGDDAGRASARGGAGQTDAPGDDAGRALARGGAGQTDAPGDDAGRASARGGAGQTDAPGAEDTGDDHQREG